MSSSANQPPAGPLGWTDGGDDGAGPVPIAGERPVPTGPAPTTGAAPTTGPAPAISGSASAAGPAPADDEPARGPLDPVPGVVPTTEAPVAAPGRAGRNLGAAIAVGAGLGGLVIASLLLWRPAFLVLLGAAVVVGVVELTRALRAGGFSAPLAPVLVGGLAMIALAWTRGPTGLVTGFLATVLAVVLWRLAHGPAGYLEDTGAGVLVALYVPLLAGFAALLLVPDDGAARVIVFIATVVCSDVGGYAAGVLFGKHAMAPSISPKKSWEGLAGSVTACTAFATVVIALWLGGPWWAGLVFGPAIAVTATFGDLAESLIKRDLGIKDMGALLPGHGGLMDRLDSLLPSAAVAYLLLSVLVPV